MQGRRQPSGAGGMEATATMDAADIECPDLTQTTMQIPIVMLYANQKIIMVTLAHFSTSATVL